MSMKAKWLDRRIAAPGPYLSLCKTEAQFIAALKHLGVKDFPSFIVNDHSDATCHYIESSKGELGCIVCIRKCDNRTPIEICGLLVHEAVHIWQAYSERIGEHSPGKEQEAYAIQAVAQELMQSYADTM